MQGLDLWGNVFMMQGVGSHVRIRILSIYVTPPLCAVVVGTTQVMTANSKVLSATNVAKWGILHQCADQGLGSFPEVR